MHRSEVSESATKINHYIDVDYYVQKAHRLRQETVRQQFAAIGKAAREQLTFKAEKGSIALDPVKSISLKH